MVKKSKKNYVKVVDEKYTFPIKRGSGIIKIEAWEDHNDNGRVIAYDNAHDYHHKHYFGEISPVEDFTSYEEIVERFENEIKEYIK